MISGQVAFEGILEVASLVASQDPVVFQADAARPDAERFQKTVRLTSSTGDDIRLLVLLELIAFCVEEQLSKSSST